MTKIIYIHGFGGKEPYSEFEKKMRLFFESINFRNKISIESYPWNSQHIDLKRITYLWEEAKKEAVYEAEKLAIYLKNLEKENTHYYLIAFSLGTFVVLNALNLMNEFNFIKKIIFMGSASPKNFKITAKINNKIINYYSIKKDKVLENLYGNIEGIPAGGLVGFDDLNNFINIKTNCVHKLGHNYLNLAEAIGYLITFNENFITEGSVNLNWEISTMGGKVFWDDIYENDKIIIQQNDYIFKRYRAIDKISNKRLCWSKNLHAVLKEMQINKW